MTNPLDDYTLVYNITSLPDIIYAQIVKASEPLYFENEIYLPASFISSQVECRFGLYNAEGELVELVSDLVPANTATIKAKVNIIPLRMIERLMATLIKNK